MNTPRVLPLLAVVALAAAGCGGGHEGAGTTAPTTEPPVTTVTTTPAPPTTTAARPIALQLFFLAPDGKLVADTRTIEHTLTPGAATLRELTNAPQGTKTAVPGDLRLTIDAGRAEVTGATLGDAALAQVVYSLTSFPTVRSVNGKTRADVEEFAPAILVEHPSPGEAVHSPLHVTGTADTFEATFQYALRDAAGNELAKHFVTASSGNGQRGTFSFDVPFSVDGAQDGTLVVYENSAENGAVIHERKIPLRLVP
jgi:hypothetical protein